jgi:hypothetical protein
MTKLDYLFKQFETILGWYKQSEEKAKFLVGLNTLLVGVVNGLVFVGAEKMRATRDGYTLLVWLLLGLSGMALVASYLFILRSMWPRHRVRDQTLGSAEKLWFFGDVASMSKEEHRTAIANWTEPDLEATMVTQNYLLSRNVWVKHEALNRAIVCTIAALVLLLALGLAYGVAVASSPVLPAG